MFFGFLNVDKPEGLTSHDVVAWVRRRVPRGVRVGHAGTLDPFATGVLVLGVGPATRLCDYVQRQAKTYVATLRLGATSTTDDPEGQISEVADARPPSPDALQAALGKFVGEIEQVPPDYSAVHVRGRRAYELARRGEKPRPEPRRVVVHRMALLDYRWPEAEVEVECGSGTYVRALARDIGAALGVGAYCAALRRTRVGVFSVEEAVGLDDLDPRQHLLSPLAALSELPTVAVAGDEQWRLLQGRAVVPGQELPSEGGEVAVVDSDGALLAIAEVGSDGRSLRPRRVFRSPR